MSDKPAPTIEPGDLLTHPWPPDTPIPYRWQRSDDLIYKRADGTEQRREDIVILRPVAPPTPLPGTSLTQPPAG